MATKAPLAEDDRTYLQKWFAYIPNDYLETPRLVKDEEFAIHEPKVGKRFARLEVIGKFCTLAKYFSIVTCITTLISLTLFRGSDISYSISDPAKLTYNFTLTLLQDPEVQNLKCPTSKNDLVLGDFTKFTFGISDVCRLVSEDLAKSRFLSYDDLSTYSQNQFDEASDYLEDYEFSSMYYDYDYGNYNGDNNYGNYSGNSNSDYSYDLDDDYYYDYGCVNHESCQTGQYCDAFNSCYSCDYYSHYGGIEDTFDKSTPACTNLSPPPPPSLPPPALNGDCSNHDGCAATHYCDGGYTCWSCETYYSYGGVLDTYDDETPACFSYTAPSPPSPSPPSDSDDDCWWCFWSISSNQDEVDDGDSYSAMALVARKEKYASRPPSSSSSNKNNESTTEVPPSPPPKKMNDTHLNKFKFTGRVRSPMKVEDSCGPNQDQPCLYSNRQEKLLQTLGTYSFCRSDDEGRTTPICRMVEKNCEYSKTIHAEAKLRLEKSLLPFSSLADKNLLQLTVNAQKENVVQSMISGLKSPESIVKQWSSANLPRLTGFVNALFTAVRGLRFRQHIENRESMGDNSNFTSHVTNECGTASRSGIQSCDAGAQIGDGVCQDICNIPECLYDGGDCLTLDLSKNPNEILNTDQNDFRKYKYRGMSQISWESSVYSNRSFDLKVNQTFDALPNEFKYFDKESVCGNPDTWYNYHGVNITDVSNATTIIENLVTDNVITTYLGYIPEAQLPSQPSVSFPLKKKMWYSCDNFRNILAPSPYAKDLSVSDMEIWLKWTQDIMNFLKEKILPGNLYTEEFGLKLETFENYVFYPLNYARVVKLATENSDSFYALNLDASLSKIPNENAEDREYNVSAFINYEKYFENSGLLSCAYTKKFKIEPSAVGAVVIGIIGGVTSGCTFVAQLLYFVLKIFALGSARQ
jgi:hypothetical protein